MSYTPDDMAQFNKFLARNPRSRRGSWRRFPPQEQVLLEERKSRDDSQASTFVI